ncbi:MAG TPA: type II toxin-antitoxin system RelE/ParE family toxin [Tepidisphaeraceae bacterium]|jgi:mRNA interferase RelE/StbE
MPATVTITPAATIEFESVPLVIRNRIIGVFERLAKWPAVSGAKPLRGDLQGSYRIRTGDYRIVFTVSPDGRIVTVWKIGNRGTVYD